MKTYRPRQQNDRRVAPCGRRDRDRSTRCWQKFLRVLVVLAASGASSGVTSVVWERTFAVEQAWWANYVRGLGR